MSSTSEIKVTSTENSVEELFDLEGDPGQQQNVIEDYPDEEDVRFANFSIQEVMPAN